MDWLRSLMNRMDPDLFSACFRDWVADCWPEHADFVAIDAKRLFDNFDIGVGV